MAGIGDNHQLGGQIPALDLQTRTLKAFLQLHELRSIWSHRLLLCLGGDESAVAFALAFVALGGTCLLVEADSERLLRINRSGATDFNVRSLSEALRILKNELRRGSSVSVGLCLAQDAATSAMEDRGVQPDAVYAPAICERVTPFLSRGAYDLATRSAGCQGPAGCAFAVSTAENAQARREADAALLAASASGTAPKGLNSYSNTLSAWLRAAPRLFPRDRTRVYWRKAE